MYLGKLACRFLLAGGLLRGGQIVAKLMVERADFDGDQLITSTGNMVTIYAAKEIVRVESEEQLKHARALAKPTKLGGTKDETRAMIREAAKEHGLPSYLMESIAETESGLKRDAVSHKGAIGVMQLMPGTAQELGVNPHDVKENIVGGTKLMRSLLLKYRNDPNQVAKALAAYNAGAGAVARYRGIPPYRETRRYVRKIVGKILDAEDKARKQE